MRITGETIVRVFPVDTTKSSNILSMTQNTVLASMIKR